jgi:hypothetical protein
VVDKREDGGYVTPVECAGEDATYISRIRKDPTVEQRPVAVGRLRQSAQGRGAQRGADRRCWYFETRSFKSLEKSWIKSLQAPLNCERGTDPLGLRVMQQSLGRAKR